jgi:hypothetical protein
MKICTNCGAEINSTEVTCPFCGWENEELAEKKRNQELSKLENINRDFIELPKKAARKTFPVFFTMAAVILVLVLAISVGTHCSNRSNAEGKYRNQQKLLGDLEELYIAGDFESMNELLSDNNTSLDASFSKYNNIGRMYTNIMWLEKDVPGSVDFAKKYLEQPDTFRYEFLRLFNLLRDCEELRANGYAYGEEAEVTDFSQRAEALLRDVLFLTDEEISRGIEISKEDNPDFTELINISFERLIGDNV